MKKLLASTAVASVLAICAFSQNASAATVSIFSENAYSGGNVNAPLYGNPVPGGGSTGVFTLSITGTTAGARSPYEDNVDGNAGAAYSALSQNSAGAGTATYNISGGTTALSFLWGSPDDYNFIAFYTGYNGTGSLISTTGANSGYFTGTDLSCYATTCNRLHWDEVVFSSDTLFRSFVLSDNGTAAFEYGIPKINQEIGITPLPAALPLFGTAITGLGLLGWSRRKKRKTVGA